MRPFFGYHMPSFTNPGIPPAGLFDHVVELARAAEANGFDLVTVMDHFYQIGVVGAEEEPMLEAYTTLGALAARTERVRLAAMVTGVTYRNPAILAKQVTTLDVISKGRAVLGIGAAWNESEHAGYGIDFPPIGERMNRLEEALQICRSMFSEERPSFTGRYYRTDRALNSPRPIQPGGPQILIGGGGERRTLRLVAQYGDIANINGPFDEVKHKLEVLDGHCEAVGRDPKSILRTTMAPVVLVEGEADASAILERIPPERRAMLRPATIEQAADILHGYRAIGFEGFIFRNPTLPTIEAIGLAGELGRVMA